MGDDFPVSEAFATIVALAERLGVKRINELPSCWEHQIDEQWWVAINAHQQEIACSTGAPVPPFHAYVTFNEWPAGLFSPRGGTIVTGEAANEATLIAAVNAAIARLEARA